MQATLDIVLKAQTEAFKKGLDSAKSSVQSFGAAVQSAIPFGVILKALDFAIEGFKSFIGIFGDLPSKINEASKFGTSVEALQGLEFAASKVGMSSEQLGGSLKFMQKSIYEAAIGGKQLSAVFDKLGLDANYISGLPLDTQLQTFADAISKVQNPSERMSLALKIFGRGAADIVPLLNKGGEGIREFQQKAEQMGLIVSGETIARIKALNKPFMEMKGIIKGALLTLGSELLPVFETITGALGKGVNWVKEQWIAWKPVVSSVISSIVAYFNMLWNMWSLAISSILEAGQQFLDWLGISLGDAGDWQDTLINVFASIEFAFTHWKEYALVAFLEVQLAAISFWENIKHAFDNIGEIISIFVDLFTDNINSIVELLGGDASDSMLSFKESIMAAWEEIKAFGLEVWEVLKEGANIVNDVFSGVVNMIKEALGTLWEYLKPIAEFLGKAFDAVVGNVEKAAGKLSKVMERPLTDAEQDLQERLQGMTDNLEEQRKQFIEDKKGTLFSKVGTAWNSNEIVKPPTQTIEVKHISVGATDARSVAGFTAIANARLAQQNAAQDRAMEEAKRQTDILGRIADNTANPLALEVM